MSHMQQSQIASIIKAREQIQAAGALNQQEAIQGARPYSEGITSQIREMDELRLYSTLKLQESIITRSAIIQDIDFDLWISTEGCTNLELMRKGNAPYMFDSPEGRIELHHIGQDFSGPFAELTLEDHNAHSQILHSSREESWRQNKKLEKAFSKERTEYWKKRARKDYALSEYDFENIPEKTFHTHQAYLDELKKTCEVIYSQCDAADLDYLSDLARSTSMMRRIGALTMEQFLKNTRDENQAEIHCSACGASDFVLHGSYYAKGERIQRYKCKACGKIFSPLNKTLVFGSLLSFRDWIKFIDCLYNGYTTRQIADTCGISERSVHENRTKLFYALRLLNDRVQLKGNVVLDETYLPVSYKGNHSKQMDFVMPRAANERGGENHKKGISRNLVCVVCAVDDNGNSVAKVVGTGVASALKLHNVLQEHVGSDVVCVYSDKSAVIRKFAEISNLEIKQDKLFRKGTKIAKGVRFDRDVIITNHYLQIINGYHSRLKKFLSHFSGISTKYLSGYLYLFAWRERSKNQEPEEAYKELLEIMTAPNYYRSTDEILNGDYLPDALTIGKKRPEGIFFDMERAKKIYQRFAKGETMASIGADYGLSRQRVSQIIQTFRNNGFAYRTEQNIADEKKMSVPTKRGMRETSVDILKRNNQIYDEKQHWIGPINEFYEKTCKKHNLSVQRVKNIVAQIARIRKLQKEIFIYEDVSYQTLVEVYREIYKVYLNLKQERKNISAVEYAEVLAAKYGYTVSNIQRIIILMERDTDNAYFEKKRKLSKTETYNRDKALFVDFLRWTGDKLDFYEYGARKYNLTPHYVYEILRYCFYADPERYNIV